MHFCICALSIFVIVALRAFSVFIALSIYISVTVLCLCYSVFVYLWHSVQEGGDWQWVIRSTRIADRQRCNLTSCITAVRMISITIMIILKFWTLIILVPIKIIFEMLPYVPDHRVDNDGYCIIAIQCYLDFNLTLIIICYMIYLSEHDSSSLEGQW